MPLPVKICGVTNSEDARAAIAAGASAIGFNLYPRSKRCIDLNRDAEWIAALPPFIARYAVVVNPALHDLEHLTALNLFNGVQLHGDESPELVRHAAGKFPHVIKALRLAEYAASGAAAFIQAGVRNILLDAAVPGEYGGTGQVADWQVAARFTAEQPTLHVVLSGGLTVDNVANAISAVRPHAVDVASGVENGDPRRKDCALLEAFIHAAQSA